MLLHLSSSNLWILVVGVALVVLHAVASSRLAPLIARLFGARHRRLPPSHASHASHRH